MDLGTMLVYSHPVVAKESGIYKVTLSALSVNRVTANQTNTV